MMFFVVYFALSKCCHGWLFLDQNGVAVERSEREGRVCRRGGKVVVVVKGSEKKEKERMMT